MTRTLLDLITSTPYIVESDNLNLNYQFEPAVSYVHFLWIENIPEQLIEFLREYEQISEHYKLINTPTDIGLLTAVLFRRSTIDGNFSPEDIATYQGEAQINEPLRTSHLKTITASFIDTSDLILTKFFRSWIAMFAPSPNLWKDYNQPDLIELNNLGTNYVHRGYATLALFATDPSISYVTYAVGGVAVYPTQISTNPIVLGRGEATFYLHEQSFNGIYFTSRRLEKAIESNLLPAIRETNFVFSEG